MSIPHDYAERVYAGVLGKLIGVYLGRPIEAWSHEKIMAELGEIRYYVHDRLGKPLVVVDDDVSGTFTFLRALPDYGNRRDLTPAQIGQTWLNYLIEERTVLWWGGLGNSTEQTAYLRLRNGIEAPRSGSIAMNGKVVAEQIGAQIFIDGWAMVAPGDPEFAAELARRAASVSHDGEAIYGAQVIAAMEAQAFVESDIDALIDTGLSFIPRDSVIYRLIGDVRDWHAKEADWRNTRQRIVERYGYDKYGGNCHVVPNHALVMHALLHGEDDFQKSLMIVNTCGWDTDCNSGNLGCLLGIKNGLAAIDAGPDWRGPVADRLYLPTADTGRAITDAVSETFHVVNIGRALADEDPLAPKDGARFHFDLPGAVQGFTIEDGIEGEGTLVLENVAGHSELGKRSLAFRYQDLDADRVTRAAAATFIPRQAADMPFFELIASPTLHPGQTVRARIEADAGNHEEVACRLYLHTYDVHDELIRAPGPNAVLEPSASQELVWRIAETHGAPIAEIGLEIAGPQEASGTIYLDYLTWDGAPDVTLTRPPGSGIVDAGRFHSSGGTMWQRAWANGLNHLEWRWPEPYRLVQNRGRGLLLQGTRDWIDYRARADVTPHFVKAAGIAVRVQGMRRYYALLLDRGSADAGRPQARLIKALDGDKVLAETDFSWSFGTTYDLSLEAVGNRLRAQIDGQVLFEVKDEERPLTGGGVALVCEEGCTATHAVRVQPAD